MASRQLMTHSPKALSYYQKQMSISEDLLAKKSRIPMAKIILGQKENEVFTVKQLERIAKNLIVPTYYLTLNTIYEKNIPELIDYRNYSDKNMGEEDKYELKKLVNEAYVDRENLIHIYESIDETIDSFALKLSGNSAIQDAERIRSFLDVDNARLRIEGSDDYYRAWRLLLEKKDVIVLEKSRLNIGSEGLCLFYETLPMIVIMTSGQTASRKLFTLIHELVHLGLRHSILDGHILESDRTIERYCNEVAGNVLVPISIIQNIYKNDIPLNENIRKIRKETKASFSAIAIQLKIVGKITQKELDSYFEDLNAKNDQSGGFGRSDKKYTTYNHFGKVYLQQVFSAVWEDALSLGGAMRILGIQKMSDLEHLEKKVFAQ